MNIPDHRTGFCVERDEPAVECADVNAAAVERRAAVDHVAAYEFRMIFGDMRIVLPQQVTGSRVHGVYKTPGARRVEHAILNERRRFEPPQGCEIERPREAEPANGLLVHLLKLAKALLGIRAAVGDPIRGVGISRLQCSIIHYSHTAAGTTRNAQKRDR